MEKRSSFFVLFESSVVKKNSSYLDRIYRFEEYLTHACLIPLHRTSLNRIWDRISSNVGCSGHSCRRVFRSCQMGADARMDGA